MFGDMMGNMQAQQEAMRQKLTTIELEAEAGDGAVVVSGTAAREITGIKFDPEKINPADTDQLEDLLIVAMNGFMEMVAEVEGEESQKMLNDLLPPGLAGMFGG